MVEKKFGLGGHPRSILAAGEFPRQTNFWAQPSSVQAAAVRPPAPADQPCEWLVYIYKTHFQFGFVRYRLKNHTFYNKIS